MSLDDHCISIASLGVQAMLYEVSCFPSPGLVSCTSQGAHQDMDYFTFLDSATVLFHPLTRCVEAGFSPRAPQEIFEEIRGIGRAGEQLMLQKTSGVNTHKGMLFLLGVCCAAAGKVLYSGAEFSAFPGIIKAMTQGLVQRELGSLHWNSLSEEKALTHGERLYLEYNLEGIRGEIERGIPLVFEYALDFYRAHESLSKNQRLVHTLIAIMQYSEDSNILHRHTLETLSEVQKRAKEIISLGGVETQQGLQAIEAMDEDFVRRKISPGGSADLLGITVFLDLLESYIDNAYANSSSLNSFLKY